MNLEIEEGEKVQSGNEGNNVRLFVEEDDIGTSLEESVGSRETGKTTADDDYTSHGGIKLEREMVVCGKKRS